MRRSSRLVKRKEREEEAGEAKEKMVASEGSAGEEEVVRAKSKRGGRKTVAATKSKAKPKAAAAARSSSKAKEASKKAKTKTKRDAPTRGRKRKLPKEESDEEEEVEPTDEDEKEEEAPAATTGGVRRSKRLRAAAARPPPAATKKKGGPDSDSGDMEVAPEKEEEEEEEEEADGSFDEAQGAVSTPATRRLAKKKMLVRSNSYSANDLLNASYRDLFGLGTAPFRPPPSRRPQQSTPEEASGSSEAKTVPATSAAPSSTGASLVKDRWVLLQHHHWLLKQVGADGRVVVQTNNFGNPGFGFAPADEGEDGFPGGADDGDLSGSQVYEDESTALPLYYDPPADGSSCFDELPTETVMQIFSYFSAATMGQAMGVCTTWKDLLSDTYFWKRQSLIAEPLVLKPYNNWNWNQYCAYAIRFIKDKPIVNRQSPIPNVSNLTHQIQHRVDPNPTDYEFEEIYHSDPVTGCGQYMLSRNDQQPEMQFGLGIVAFHSGSWGGATAFKSDAWWLEHYMIGSRPEEDLLSSKKTYKSLCNPKLWRWRLLHSDGKEEITGVLLVNVGYLEQLVEEGCWRDQLTQVDVQFLYHVMNDAATLLDYSVYDQQSIPHWLQCHKQEERQRRREERKLLRESQSKGKEKADSEDQATAMETEPASQGEGGAVVVAPAVDKPFRHTKPEAVVSKLYSYQLESLTWMTEIEDRVSRGLYWEAIRLIGFPEHIGSHIYMNPDGTALCTYEQLDKFKHFLRVYTRGGILAEEMGLGKTLIVLALITLQRQNIEKIFDRDETLYPLAANMFRTKATLVLCPSHLAKQWETEVAKHTNPPLKVFVITTILQHRAVTYKDILDADLVVVSFSFLVNKNYGAVRPSCHPSSLGDDDPKLAQRASPVLTQFRWLRMVLDEAHELPMGIGRKGKTGIDDIAEIQATFRWYITGSPFPQGRASLHNALDLLRLRVKKPVDPDQKEKTPQETNEEEGLKIQQLRWNGTTFMPNVELEVMRNLYCRHTKQSVSNEYTLPGVQNQVILLRQTVVERALYEVAKIENRDDEMRQLCCHPQLSNTHLRMGGIRERNLWELFTDTIANKRAQIKSTTTSLDSTKTALQGHEQHLKDLKSDWKRQRAWLPNWKPTKGETERRLGLKNSIRKEKKEISSLEASLEMYEKSLAHLKEVDARYSITKQAENKAKGEPLDTKMEEEDREDGLAVLAAATKELPSAQFMAPDSISEDLVALHGSKMPHLLLYVQQLCEDDDSRIIIFSQWTRLLMLIGNLLEEHGVRTIFCRGNVYQRNKAIAAFQKSVGTQQPKKVVKGKEPEPLPRVLMLSLENAASGTNLTQATHIILVDPICGSRSRAHAIEAQAIGRAHRLGQTQKLTVVRFLVVDTIEHETYLRNYVNKRESPDDDEEEEELVVPQPTLATAKRKEMAAKEEANPL